MSAFCPDITMASPPYAMLRMVARVSETLQYLRYVTGGKVRTGSLGEGCAVARLNTH
jgi:hypothetical protein